MNATGNLCIARLGEHGFDSPQAAGAFTLLLTLTRASPDSNKDHHFAGLDVSEGKTAADKNETLKRSELVLRSQALQLKNPDARITLTPLVGLRLLSDYAHSMRGIVSGDTDLWTRCFWEVRNFGTKWRVIQSTTRATVFFGGREHIIDWSTDGYGMLRPGTRNKAYGCRGVSVALMRDLPCTLYTGELYDNNCGAVVPHEPEHLAAIWAYCSSAKYLEDIRGIDQKVNVTNATLVKVPFDVAHWIRVASESFSELPKPHSDDPTQWLFNGHPKGSEQPLQVAVARLAGHARRVRAS